MVLIFARKIRTSRVLVTNRNESLLVLILAFLSLIFGLFWLFSANFGLFRVNGSYFYSGSYFYPKINPK